jgi:hypothetical protein
MYDRLIVLKRGGAAKQQQLAPTTSSSTTNMEAADRTMVDSQFTKEEEEQQEQPSATNDNMYTTYQAVDFFETFLLDHTPAASSGRSAAPQSASLRSCLKKQNGNKKDRSQVEFAEMKRMRPIESLKGRHYLWTDKRQHEQRLEKDLHQVQTDKMVEEYIWVHDAAHVELNCGDGEVEHHDLQLALVCGIAKGYRTLEYFSEANQQRIELAKLARKSVVAAQGSLPLGDNRDELLCQYSQDLSRDSRQWAGFQGEMDAYAAVLEYAESPPCNLESAPCIWTLPVASVPTQRRESLVKRLLSTNVYPKNWNIRLPWSGMKRRRAVHQKRTPAV